MRGLLLVAAALLGLLSTGFVGGASPSRTMREGQTALGAEAAAKKKAKAGPDLRFVGVNKMGHGSMVSNRFSCSKVFLGKVKKVAVVQCVVFQGANGREATASLQRA